MIDNLSKLTEVRKIALRSSGMSDFERCPRYFLLKHRAGLTPKGTETPALQRGAMFHQIVADILGGMQPGLAEVKAMNTMRDAANEATSQVGPAGFLPDGRTPDEVLKDNEENTKVAIAMSRAYCKFFQVKSGKLRDMKVLPNWTEMLVTGDDFGVKGAKSGMARIDAVVTDGKRAYIVDHKTCGWDLDTYMATLPLTAQTLLYPMLVAPMLPPDLALGGIIYNVIKTPSIRCCKTDGYNLDKYVKRVEEWYQENESTVLAQTTIIPSFELQKLSKKRLDRARHACISLPVLSNFPATGGAACSRYNALCPYIRLCTRDTAAWPKELERFNKTWRDDETEKENE